MRSFESSTSTRSREGAQATVEFAMVLPVLCLILFGALQFGIAFWQVQQVSHAASAGARMASVSRTAADRDQRIVTAVVDGSPDLNLSATNVGVASTWSPGDEVTVSVSYPITLTVLGKTYYDKDFVSTRTARVEH